MLKVLTILGSPREKGNSKQLAEYIINGILSTEGDVEVQTIAVCKEKIQPCIACDGCHRKPGCVIQDDMQNLYQAFDHADLVVVASPVYFNAVSAQLKALIDRCQAIWASKYILHNPIIDRNKQRIGVFVATAGNPDALAEFAPSDRIMDLFFKAINTKYVASLFISNTDQEPVHSRPEILNQAFAVGVQMMVEFRKESTKEV